MAQSTRERLVAVAETIFYRDGFHSVGLDRIVAEAGVTKTTFYNHFTSKDDLILAVLEARDEWWRRNFGERLRERAGENPEAQLRAIFDVLDEYIDDARFNGCIFVNVSVEFPAPHVPAHRAAAEHKGRMEALLRELATRAGAADPDALAATLSLLMEGTYVTRQVTGNRQAAAIARRAAAIVLDAHLARPA